jgi:hypothetical protein
MSLPYYWTPEETPAQVRMALAVYAVAGSYLVVLVILGLILWHKERNR